MRSRLVVCLIALAMLGAACGSGTAVSTTTSGPVTSTTVANHPPPTIAVDLSATPSGWVPVAYGDGQISVPADWIASYGSGYPCLGGNLPAGEVLVNAGPGPVSCPATMRGKPAAIVNLEPLSADAAKSSKPPLMINGIVVRLGGVSIPKGVGMEPIYTYLVPSLGVQITVSGSLGFRVLDTLTRSPRDIALATGPAPPVPSSWHRVTFAGVRFSVPADCSIQRTETWNICAPLPVALWKEVVLDTDRVFLRLPCAFSQFAVTPADGVRVDSGRQGPTGSFSPGGTCLHSNGLTACPSSTPDYSILVLKVLVPGRATLVTVSIGLAGNGIVTRTILYSLRAA